MNDQIIVHSVSEDFELEIFYLAKMFFQTEKAEIFHTSKTTLSETTNEVKIIEGGKETILSQTDKEDYDNPIIKKRMQKRHMKQCVYKALCKHTGKSMAWGCLTGVRPTFVAYELLEEGVDISVLKEVLQKEFFLSDEKAKLLYETVKNQKSIIKNDHLISLYINIPVCPSRCSYCSFISADINAVKILMPTYVDTLIKEIRETKKIIFDKSYIVRTIYIGGGTPSILSAEELDKVLSELNYPVTEFTVECGRADTITEEKLIVLKNHGVTRICINPQTFTVKTLKLINRNVTNQQVFDAYMLAVKYGFIVNMDFIAGLEGETLTNFKKTINTALELSPQNMTVHTLFLKKKSEIGQNFELLESADGVVKSMVDYAYEKLTANGYKPYYLYRQKNQVENLENVGYAQNGKNCIFNIDTMEETLSVIACGANGISKRIFGNNKQIERFASPKGLTEYIDKIDEICEKKKQLFC